MLWGQLARESKNLHHRKGEEGRRGKRKEWGRRGEERERRGEKREKRGEVEDE